MTTKRFLLFVLLAATLITSNATGESSTEIGVTVGYTDVLGSVDPKGLEYIPDSVLFTKDEVVYLYNESMKSLFRWSISQRKYFSTISLSQAPTKIAYSSETNRIYLSYAYDRITQIKLDQAPIQEVPFTNISEYVNGLATAGNYIFTHDLSGTNRTYDLNGNLISSKEFRNFSWEYIWSHANRKMYYLRDDTSPNDLYWEAIAEDGTLGEIRETPYHENEPFKQPIRVKPDGSHVLLGTGWIFDANTLEKETSLPNTITDAAWSCDNLYTLREKTGGSLAQKWGEGYIADGEKEIRGNPIKVYPISEGLLYITQFRDIPWFTILDCNLNRIYETPYFENFVPIVEKDFCSDFLDDFSRPSTGWEIIDDEYIKSDYLTGEFRVLTKSDEYYYMFRAPDCQRRYNLVEIDARWQGEPGGSYGIVYGLNQDWTEYSLFLVYSEFQEFGLYDISGSTSHERTFQYSTSIHPGSATNHLKVTRNYDDLKLEINGTLVFHSNDPSNHESTYVGLVVNPYIGFPNADARFDNFAVKSIEKIVPGTAKESILDQGYTLTSLQLPALDLKMPRLFNP